MGILSKISEGITKVSAPNDEHNTRMRQLQSKNYNVDMSLREQVQICKDYLEEFDFLNDLNVVGMRLVDYYAFADPFHHIRPYIEFITTNNKRMFLIDDEMYTPSNTWGMVYTTQDDIAEVCKALSLIIPRFKNVSYEFGIRFNGLYERLDGKYNLDSKRSEVEFELDNSYGITVQDGYTDEMMSKLKHVVDAWLDRHVKSIFAASVYDSWITNIYRLQSELIEYSNRIEAEKKRLIDEEVKKAGEKGESEVRYALKWLTNELRLVFPSAVKIYNPEYIDEPQEFDHIVVGPCGVILVETKNYSGEIEIDNNGNWRRKKDDEWIGVKNPLQQVRRHEKLMRSILPKHIPIKSFVCIANDNAIIDGAENSVVPVCKSDMIAEVIEDYNRVVTNNSIGLSDQDIDECITLIKKYEI